MSEEGSEAVSEEEKRDVFEEAKKEVDEEEKLENIEEEVPLPDLDNGVMDRIRKTNMFASGAPPNIFRVGGTIDHNFEKHVHFIYLFDTDFKEYFKAGFTQKYIDSEPDFNYLTKSFEDIVIDKQEMYMTPNGFESSEWTTLLYKDFLYISVLFERNASSFLRYQVLNVDPTNTGSIIRSTIS